MEETDDWQMLSEGFERDPRELIPYGKRQRADGTGWAEGRRAKRALHFCKTYHLPYQNKMADDCQIEDGKLQMEELLKQPKVFGTRGLHVSDFMKHHLNIESNTLQLEDLTHAQALYCLQALGQIEPVVLLSVCVKTLHKDFTVQMDSANNSLSVLKERILERCGYMQCGVEIYNEHMELIADDAVITGNCDVSAVFVSPLRFDMTVPKNSCINGDFTLGDFTDGLVSVASF